jgi:protoporphyrinogen oxidase
LGVCHGIRRTNSYNGHHVISTTQLAIPGQQNVACRFGFPKGFKNRGYYSEHLGSADYSTVLFERMETLGEIDILHANNCVFTYKSIMTRRKFLTFLLSLFGSTVFPSATAPVRLSNNIYDAIIIGAGISGLTAGCLLQDRSVLVLEALDRTGGRIVSGKYAGFSYAKGAEYIGRPRGIMAELVKKTGVVPVEIPWPMDITFMDGNFLESTSEKMATLIRQGGADAFNRLLLSLYEVAPHYISPHSFHQKGPLSRLDTLTCSQWFKEMNLPPIYFEIFNVMSRGIFGASLNEISAMGALEELFFEMAGLEPVDDYRDISNHSKRTEAFSFEKGIAELTDALAEQLGESLLTLHKTEHITSSPGQGYDVHVQSVEGKKIFRARTIIMATPAPITLKIAGSVLDNEQLHILNNIPFSTYATLAVFTNQPFFSKGFDLSVPDGLFFTDIYDSTWVERHIRGKRAAGPAITSFYIAPTSYRDLSIKNMKDQQLLDRCMSELKKKLGIYPDRILGYDVQRFEKGLPVLIPGAFKRLSRFHRRSMGPLQVAGDSITYPTIEGAVAAAALAVGKIRKWI